MTIPMCMSMLLACAPSMTRFCPCVAANILFVTHRRLMTCGILIMLALIYLAIFLGWLPFAGSLFNFN